MHVYSYLLLLDFIITTFTYKLLLLFTYKRFMSAHPCGRICFCVRKHAALVLVAIKILKAGPTYVLNNAA